MKTPTEAQILATAKTLWKVAFPPFCAAGGSPLAKSWKNGTPATKAALCAIARWHLTQKAYKR